MVEAAEEIEGDVGLAVQEEVSGMESRPGSPGAIIEEILEYGGVGSAESHVQSFDGEIPGRRALQGLKIGRGMEPGQLIESGWAGCDFAAFRGAEQAEGKEAVTDKAGFDWF
jgi:hypothetical protein